MTEYHSVKVQLPDPQPDKLKSATKNVNGVTPRLSSDIIGTDETFPHNLLLTDRQIAGLCKAFANNSSKGIKLSKTQISKIIQLGGFLDRLLGPLMKVDLSLMENVLIALTKSLLLPLGLTAAAAADAGIH